MKIDTVRTNNYHDLMSKEDFIDSKNDKNLTVSYFN